MIFKVSEKLKGSCVLTTLNKAISAGMTILIEGNNLNAGDIKAAIREGVLISADKKYTQEVSKKKHDVIIVNKTEKVIVLDNFVLRPLASMYISKDDQNSPSIQTAKENGLINIISDEKEKPKVKEVSKSPIKEEKVDYVVPKSGEDREVKPKTWDFRAQKIKEAQPVPKSEEVVRIDENEENEDVEFVDDKKKKTTKKKSKKKTTKKKIKKKTTKKKEITKKNKKVKTIEPVGEQKIPKNVMDAAIELDSRGNPIVEKPSEILQHMIDELNAPKDVDFADKQQAQERHNKRNDIG